MNPALTNKNMEHLHDGNGIKGLFTGILTMIFLWINSINLQAWAAIAAICAGFGTAAYYIVKVIYMIKGHNHKKKFRE